MSTLLRKSLTPAVRVRAQVLTAPQDVIALAQSNFTSLQNTKVKDLVVVGFGGGHFPMDGAEILEGNWEGIYTNMYRVTLSFRHGVYPLASEDSTEVTDRLIRKRKARTGRK